MKASLPVPCLALVTDLRLCRDVHDLIDRVSRAVEGGVDLVQLREKELAGGPLLRLGEKLRKITQGSALLFVNDRVDVALACGADGVQLGEDGIPVASARSVSGDSCLIGRSVHNVEGARAAELSGADFLVAGAVFATSSHPGAEPAGPQMLARMASRTDIPFLGIGGIDATNIGQVVDAGASGAAVISAILTTDDPERASRELKEALGLAWRADRSEPGPAVGNGAGVETSGRRLVKERRA